MWEDDFIWATQTQSQQTSYVKQRRIWGAQTVNNISKTQLEPLQYIILSQQCCIQNLDHIFLLKK